MSASSSRPTELPMDREALARALVKAAYLEGDFLLRSGKRSKYYFDKYLFETRPDLLGPLARLMATLLPEGVDRLAGQELGGVPLATALSLETGLPFVIIRKEHKEHGTSKIIEGELKVGERLVLVEDILTTGGQAIAGAKVAQAQGAHVLFILGVVDREEGATQNIAQAGFRLNSVFTRSELEGYLENRTTPT